MFYELSAAKRALSPNYIATRPGFSQEYRGLELTLQRRLTARWQAVGSMTFGVQRENLGDSRDTLLAVERHHSAGAPAGLPTPQDVDKTNRHAARHVDPRHRQADGQLPCSRSACR